MKLNLVVVTEGKAAGKTIAVTLSQFIIGRDPQCQLRPASALISKRHCALISRTGKYFVRDFDSTNGTFVNGDQVKGERELMNDDILVVGPLTFKVAIEGSPLESKKPPPPKTNPAPAPAPPPPSKRIDEDDSVGNMLLDLADEEGGEAKEPESIPGGTTITEGMAPGGDPSAANETKTDVSPVKELKPSEKKKSNSGDTSAAAEALLQKYMRRQRT